MPDHRRGLARSSSGIAVLAGAGVLSGFLVDATMAAIFGADADTDAFFIAATIPFALASLLLASANQALVPLIHRWFQDLPGTEAVRRVEGLLGTMLAGSAVVGAVGAMLSPLIPMVLAPGAALDTRRAATTMTALLFATVVTRVGAEILRALLNARFSFTAPAAMPLVENGAVLAVILLLHGRLGVPAVAVGYLAGGILQLAFVGIAAAMHGSMVRPRVRFRDPDVVSALRLLALPLSGTGLTMLARAAERFLASFLPEGQITILNYAWVVVNSIGGAIFFRSVVVALLPRLSAAREEPSVTRRIVADGVRLMSLISLPLLTFVVILAQPLVTFAFQRGAFGVEDAALLASVMAIYALQFPFDAVNRVYVSYWYARFDTLIPFKNVALGVGLDILFAVILFVPLGIHGIALGYVLSSVGYLAHGALSVHRRIDLPVRALATTAGKVLLASAFAGAAAVVTLGSLAAEGDLRTRLLRLAVPGVVGLVALVVGLAVLRIRIWSLVLSRERVPPVDEDGP